jgi:hypothetical protein
VALERRNNGFPDTPADDRIRQGRIVLNSPARRFVFFGALIAIGVFCLVVALIAAA